ncbi:MAG: hypothetical protein DRP11_02460 [Candidatus Aenigmatarchaeota archaeon]|nr:MAG: hypothetical protein DRP11_02460 [Candidatus Aenigmarchaeota archaeon]
MNIKDIGRFEKWELKDYLIYIPVFISTVVIILSILLSGGDTSVIAVAVMFGLIVSITPYFFYNYLRLKSIKSMEEQLSNFLRDMVESKKSGMTLPAALAATTKNDYGKLSTEIKKMYYQLSWGVPFEKVLKKFGERVKESDLINRSIRIIIEAYRSGGDVAATMETVSSDVAIIKEAQNERKSKLGQYVMTMYIIYFLFIAIAILLSKMLVGMTSMEGISSMSSSFGIGGSGGIGACISKPVGGTGFVCSFFIGIAKIFGLGGGLEGYYNALFFSMILIQGFLSGLLAGQIGDDSVMAGLRHSLIMSVAGFVIFILAIKLV